MHLLCGVPGAFAGLIVPLPPLKWAKKGFLVIEMEIIYEICCCHFFKKHGHSVRTIPRHNVRCGAANN